VTISSRIEAILAQRGIFLRSELGTRCLRIRPSGLSWILNYLNQPDSSASNFSEKFLNTSFLQAVASFQKTEKSWRELRILAVSIPVYESEAYCQLVIYLNAHPPRLFHTFAPDVHEIGESFAVSVLANGKLKIRAPTRAFIEFSEDQVSSLNAGGLLRIS